MHTIHICDENNSNNITFLLDTLVQTHISSNHIVKLGIWALWVLCQNTCSIVVANGMFCSRLSDAQYSTFNIGQDPRSKESNDRSDFP